MGLIFFLGCRGWEGRRKVTKLTFFGELVLLLPSNCIDFETICLDSSSTLSLQLDPLSLRNATVGIRTLER